MGFYQNRPTSIERTQNGGYYWDIKIRKKL